MGAQVVGQLPAKLLHGPQRIPFLQWGREGRKGRACESKRGTPPLLARQVLMWQFPFHSSTDLAPRSPHQLVSTSGCRSDSRTQPSTLACSTQAITTTAACGWFDVMLYLHLSSPQWVSSHSRRKMEPRPPSWAHIRKWDSVPHSASFPSSPQSSRLLQN